MTDPEPVVFSSWEEFLSLGEELLSQPDAESLCTAFSQAVRTRLRCNARLWLAEPFYPLPGEKKSGLLPSKGAPVAVQKAFEKRSAYSTRRKRATKSVHPDAIALPVITQDNLLGVLFVERPEEEPFDPQDVVLLRTLMGIAALAMQVNRQVSIKNWRYDQLSLVRSVSSQITNIMNLDDLCSRVTNLIQCSFNYYHVGIFTLDGEERKINFRASSLGCLPNQENLFKSVDFEKGLVGAAARKGKEVLANDVTREPLYQAHASLPDTKAEVVLPLIADNRILGVLDIQSNEAEAFHENDMLVLRSLGDTIALAIESTRLFTTLDQRAAQLSAVAEIGYVLSSILNLEELLNKVVTIISSRFSIPYVHIFTVHSNRMKVIFQAGTSPQAQKLKPNAFAVDLNSPTGIIPTAARSGITILANDVASSPLYTPSRYFPKKVRSELTIPLKFGDDVTGVLDLQSDKLRAFTQADLDLFESLASGIALSLRNASLFHSESWRRQVSDSFRDIAGLLITNLALPDLLDRILEALESSLPCDASAVWLTDNNPETAVEERALNLAAVRGVPGKKIILSTEESIPVRNFLNKGITSNEPVIRQPDDPIGPLGAARKFKPNYSSLAVPLRSGDEILGVLTLAHHTEGRYGSEASAIATTLASYAAVAIQNARLYATAQEEAWSSTVLLQVAEAMQSITTVDALLSTIVRLAPLLVGIEQCAVLLIQPDNETFKLMNWYGFQPLEREKQIKDTEAVALLRLHATLAPVFVTDPETELGLKSLQHSEKIHTLVLVPLIAHGELHGAFLVSHNSKGAPGTENRFTDQTLAILQGIAQQMTVGLENIRLLENRQEEAYVTAVLLQVAQAVVSQNDLQDILDTIVQLMPILAGVDTCVVYLWDAEETRYKPAKVATPSHTEQEEILGRSFLPGEFPLLDWIHEQDSIAGCLLPDPETPFTTWRRLNCQMDMNASIPESSSWLLGFPLGIKGEHYGIMLTRETNIQAAYHQKRVELIKGVAQQTALAIQNERLKIEMVDRERIEREMQLARQIQKTFLPQTMPEIDGWEVDLRWRTAREVGGDFYDVFTTRDGRIAFAIADVADKGMPAALYMTVTRTLIRSAAQSLSSPADVMTRVNELLEEESENGMFVTAIYAVLDPRSGVLEYANAGHNLPLLFRHHTRHIERLARGGVALGVLEGEKYPCHKISMKEGDTLLFYTDGVTETFSPAGEQFSEKRLLSAFKEDPFKSASELLEGIEEHVTAFRQDEPVSDDLTMLAIHRLKKDS